MSSEVTISSTQPIRGSLALLLPKGMDWKQGWKELARQKSDILSKIYPDELPGTSPAQRADLWRMALLSNISASNCLKDLSNSLNGEPNSGISYILSILEVLGAGITTIIFLKYVNINSDLSYMLSFIFVMSSIVDATRRIDNLGKRSNYFHDLIKKLNELNPLSRLLSSLKRACKANASLSPELNALMFMGNEYSINWEGLSGLGIKDCMALSSLADSMKKGVNVLRDGALLTLGGDSSELLNRVAMLAYGKDLGEMSDELGKPQQLSF